jgi:hypothetical protein
VPCVIADIDHRDAQEIRTVNARPLDRRPSAAALRFAITSVVFVAVYTACNQLTSTRGDIGHGLLDWDHLIPFVPWTVLPYLSIVGFFALSFFVGRDRAALDRHIGALMLDLAISIACYAAFPLRFMFDRPEVDGLCGLLFQLVGATDLPYNRAPSLHISVLVILWVRFAPLLAGWQRRALDVWFALIGISVLTTWQHHMIDVPAGAAVGLLCLAATSERGRRSVATIVERLRAALQGATSVRATARAA